MKEINKINGIYRVLVDGRPTAVSKTTTDLFRHEAINTLCPQRIGDMEFVVIRNQMDMNSLIHLLAQFDEFILRESEDEMTEYYDYLYKAIIRHKGEIQQFNGTCFWIIQKCARWQMYNSLTH